MDVTDIHAKISYQGRTVSVMTMKAVRLETSGAVM